MFEIDDYIRLGLSRKNAAIYFDTINQTFQKYNINSCIRIAHFLAQVGHESGDFVFLKELWGPTEDQKGYERDFDFIWPPTLKDNTNRKAYGLGNKDVGDGKKFMGRGAIQITGRNNYEDYGLYVSTDFIEGSNNENLKNLPFCIDSAGWFWSVHLDVDLNTLADKNDITHITKKINGGVNGLADRKARLIKILNIMEFCLNHDPINIPTNA
jgi:putative chitinase